MKLKWVGRAVSKGQSGSSRRRRDITLLGDGNEEGTVVSAHSHSGNWNRKSKKESSMATNWSIESKIDPFQTKATTWSPHSTCVFSLPLESPSACLCKSKGRSFQSRGRSFEISIHFRSIPVLYASFFPLQILGESSQSWQGTVFNS